jgi:cyclohexadieny/prephenate dehydrogenase
VSEHGGSGTRAAALPGRLAVLGLGQLGGSLALAGRAAGVFAEVVGFGRRVESLARARELGLADRTTTSAADAVAGAGTVVLSTPLGALGATAEAIAPALAPGALVVDVGSVKGMVDALERRLPDDVDFVGCHPLAGTERFGPEAASADLYRGRICLVCPTARTSATAVGRARALWQAVGAEVRVMDAAAHDAVMAAVSHLPHVAAYALARALGDLPPETAGPARTLPTTSLRDTSRVAASSPVMWRDIFLENRAALLPLIAALEARVSELHGAVAAGDGDRIQAFLEAARAGRAALLPGS